jgi:UDP-N-acetylmuramoylalanine--D-glutamate ligase
VSDFGKIKDKYKKDLIDNNEWEEEGHTEDLILNATVVMKSPGIPDKASIVKKLVEKGIAVISEIEFAAPFTKAVTIVKQWKDDYNHVDLSFA